MFLLQGKLTFAPSFAHKHLHFLLITLEKHIGCFCVERCLQVLLKVLHFLIYCRCCCSKWSYSNSVVVQCNMKVGHILEDYLGVPRLWGHCSVGFQYREKQVEKIELVIVI